MLSVICGTSTSEVEDKVILILFVDNILHRVEINFISTDYITLEFL